MDEKEVERLSVEHNVTYEPELYADQKTLLSKVPDTQVLIVRNKTTVDEELLNSVNKLKIIGRLGVGLDNINVPICKERNLPIVVADGANANSVNEYVIMGLLSLFRKTMSSTESILSGKWDRTGHIGSEINGKKIGRAHV